MKNYRLILSAVVIGLLAGVLLDVATFFVARYGPQADQHARANMGARADYRGAGAALVLAPGS